MNYLAGTPAGMFNARTTATTKQTYLILLPIPPPLPLVVFVVLVFVFVVMLKANAYRKCFVSEHLKYLSGSMTQVCVHASCVGRTEP
jgi:hypothetical protein